MALRQHFRPDQLAVLYYGVCVPVRMALAASVAVLPRSVVAIALTAAVGWNAVAATRPRRVWWDNRGYAVVSAAAAFFIFTDRRRWAAALLMSAAVYNPLRALLVLPWPF